MKKTRKVIIEILAQTNKFIKNERKLFELTKDLKRMDGEHYSYDNYFDILDMCYLIFTGETRDKRESSFGTPSMVRPGQIIAWIYRDDSYIGGFNNNEHDSKLITGKRFYDRSGYIGDIISDIVFDIKIEPETKYKMLSKFFKLQDLLQLKAKRIR